MILRDRRLSSAGPIGIVQGIGQALLERLHFEPGTAQVLTGTFGIVPATAAIMNALCDTPSLGGIEMPATPERIWRHLHEVGQAG